jgi:hypothetical protein
VPVWDPAPLDCYNMEPSVADAQTVFWVSAAGACPGRRVCLAALANINLWMHCPSFLPFLVRRLRSSSIETSLETLAVLFPGFDRFPSATLKVFFTGGNFCYRTYWKISHYAFPPTLAILSASRLVGYGIIVAGKDNLHNKSLSMRSIYESNGATTPKSDANRHDSDRILEVQT